MLDPSWRDIYLDRRTPVYRREYYVTQPTLTFTSGSPVKRMSHHGEWEGLSSQGSGNIIISFYIQISPKLTLSSRRCKLSIFDSLEQEEDHYSVLSLTQTDSTHSNRGSDGCNLQRF